MGRFKRKSISSRHKDKVKVSPMRFIQEEEKKKEETSIDKLVKEYFMAMKYKKRFGSFVNEVETLGKYLPLVSITRRFGGYEVELNEYVAWKSSYEPSISAHFDLSNLRLCLTKLVDVVRNAKYKQTKQMFFKSYYTRNRSIQDYIEYKLKDYNEKIYPNPMFYGVLFGTIFSLVGLASFCIAIYLILGVSSVALYLTMVLFVLVIFLGTISIY